MSKQARVVWTEGLFLRPEHLQQCERYHDRQRNALREMLDAAGWGLYSCEIDQDLLKIGKLGFRHISGLLPDGQAFDMPADDPLPEAVDISNEVRDQIAYLALPLKNAGKSEFSRENSLTELHRYRIIAEEIRDCTGASTDPALLEVGIMQPRLLLQSELRDSYAAIPVACISEVTADQGVQLDPDYIASSLNTQAAPPLQRFLKELRGLIAQRAETLAARVGGNSNSGVADVADFLMLQILNRALPLVEHYQSSLPLHPERLYVDLIELAGELATYNSDSRRPEGWPEYKHSDLTATFQPVFASLRRALSSVVEQTAIQIPIKQKQYGVRVAMVPDRALYQQATFVLALKADMPMEQLTQNLPSQGKIGPVEKIRDLVNLQLPGITLRPLPAAPRQVPYHAGHAYFELARDSSMWAELQNSGGVAMYFSTDIPGLSMQMWAIRNG